MSNSSGDITGLLKQWSAGDEQARDRLIPLVYQRLHDLAHHRLRAAPAETSLNTTGLVHEAYLRLAAASGLDLPDRAHFFGLASTVMRNLLVDRARSHMAAKNRSGQPTLALQEAFAISDEQSDRVLELDEALRRLEMLSPRQAQLLQHRYFGGLTLDESARAVGVSIATAKRELRLARAWLALELKDPVE